MRVYIPDMTEFFRWIESQGLKYVVLRGFADLEGGYPQPGTKRDIDFLVEDGAVKPIRDRYGKYSKRKGVKCDVYDVSGKGDGAYLKYSYFPQRLAEEVLSGRRMWRDRFYVPGARGHLLSLLYHISYQKSERSGIHIDDVAQSMESKYIPELNRLKAELGIDLAYTLLAFHAFLKKAGYGLPHGHLVNYLQNDFDHDHKSLFLAKIAAEAPGEMNLFVIRGVAVSQKLEGRLMDELKKHYEILMVKPIPLLTRLFKSGHMRGGKWRRGGRPHIAVIVFDPQPQPVGEADRKIHPFVFNARQFMKRPLREWFTVHTGLKASLNPIHSTDNEAEALGHLHYFFDAQEQAEIVQKLGERRRQMQPAQGLAAAS